MKQRGPDAFEDAGPFSGRGLGRKRTQTAEPGGEESAGISMEAFKLGI